MTGDKHRNGVAPGIVVLWCLVAAIAAGLTTGYFYFREKFNGSAVAYSRQAVKDLTEGSMEYKIAKMFYSEDEFNAIRADQTAAAVPEQAETDPLETQGIRIDRISGPTYEGYMMLVKNPEDVTVAINPNLDDGSTAPSLEEYVASANAIGGINAGGFEDAGGNGNGGQAYGIVIHDGQLVSGSLSTYSSVIGIDSQNKLICADITAQKALEWGIKEAVTFGPVFIQDYQVTYQDGDGEYPMLNPRTAIGQRADGTFLLLVIDGRGPTSFGALYEDVVKIFQEYDAQTAANLDGGNSTAMIYQGEYVNTTVSMYGSRHLPTVFLVKGDN